MKTNWIASVLSFFGASIAGFLFLFFLFSLKVLENDGILLTFGILFLIITILVSQNSELKEKPYFESILFSFYGQGMILFIFGMYANTSGNKTAPILLTILLVLVISYFTFQNSIQKFLTFPLITFNLVLLSFDLNLPWLVTAIVFLNLFFLAFSFMDPKNKLTSQRISISISLLLLNSVSFFPEHISKFQNYLTSFILFVSIVVLFSKYLIEEIKLSKLYVLYSLIFVSFLFSAETPGIITSFLVFMFAYRFKHNFLLVLASIILVCYISSYYYQLEVNLLQKSILLLAFGTIHLGSFFLYKKFIQEKV